MTYNNSDPGWSLPDYGLGSVYDAIKDAASNFSQYSDKACELIMNPVVQAGGNAAAVAPNPYAMAAGTAIVMGGKLCAGSGEAGGVKLPAGSIATISKEGGFRIAIPIGTSLSGALGQVTHQDLGPAPAPLTATVVSTSSYQKSTGTRPWYKKPLILGGIAAGVVVLGGGTYFLVRR